MERNIRLKDLETNDILYPQTKTTILIDGDGNKYNVPYPDAKTIETEKVTIDSNGKLWTKHIDIDSEMSNTSENPVQNKIIKAYVDAETTRAEGVEASLESTKQDKTDNSLNTTDKTVVGAINELKEGLDSTKIISLDSYLPEGLVNEISTYLSTGEFFSKWIMINNASELKNKIKATINNDSRVLFSITIDEAPFVFSAYIQGSVDTVVEVMGEAIFPMSLANVASAAATNLFTNYSLLIDIQLADSESVLILKGCGEILPLDKYYDVISQAADNPGQTIALPNSDLLDYITSNIDKTFKLTDSDSSQDISQLFYVELFNIDKVKRTKTVTLNSLFSLPAALGPGAGYLSITVSATGITVMKEFLQLSTSDELKTTSRRIVGAINELKTTTDTLNTNKQNITDNSLTTTNKTIPTAINEINTNLSSHTSNTSNPHSVTKEQVGLGSVVNAGQTSSPTESSNEYFTAGGAYTLQQSLNSSISTKQDKTDESLSTTNKTVVGAINELKTSTDNLSSSKQNINDNALTTTSKTVPGAINELKTKADSLQSQITSNDSDITNLTNNKQDKTDSTLTTNTKTIVGAINEVNANINSFVAATDEEIRALYN